MIKLRDVQAVVTDIEGTTSSLAFVKEELFPYARAHLGAYLRDHESELGDITAQIEAATGSSRLSTPQMVATLLRWMDEDRKFTPLKTLQGMIWKSGYERGQLRGHVYEDAMQALRRWHARGIRIFIYSSGSVEAQKLLFSHSSYGDLTPLIAGYFDTTSGPKLESHSYERIGRALGVAARSIVFLSDHLGETAAAAAAGMQTILLAREQVSGGAETTAHGFDEIDLGE